MSGLKQRDKAYSCGSRGGSWAERRGLEDSRPGCREPGSGLELLLRRGKPWVQSPERLHRGIEGWTK